MKKNFSNTIPVPQSGIKKLLLIMKLALAFVLMSVLQVSANVYSQSTINLNVQDKSLRDVLKTIEQRSSFRFFYSDDLVLMNKTVDVNANNQKVVDVLDNLFASSELTYRVFENNLIVIVPKSEIMQEMNVTGVVTDSKGEPLPGVNIVIEGTTIGAVTDMNGRYSLKVPGESSVLVFSYIGFLTEKVEVGSRRTIDLKMVEDVQNLQEVVVTALGIKRETKKLGYAVTEVKGEDVAKANTVNPIASLQGKAAGLSIGGSDGGLFGAYKIGIRGVSTLKNNNQPIFVVDGVILNNEISGDSEWSSSSNDWGNQLKNLNPDDFESVSILKGSASTALYGSRGLNGAVIITTKNAKKSKGLGVSISQTTGMDYVYRTPDFQNDFGIGGLAGYIDYGKKDANGSFYAFDTKQFYYKTIDGAEVASIQDHPWGGLSWGPRFDGRPILDYDGKMTTWRSYEDNMKDAYNIGFNTNTNVTVTGGNETTNFYFSESYQKRTGIYPGNTFARNSILLKGAHQLSKRISVEGSVNYVQSSPENPAGDLGQFFFDGTFERSYNTKYYKDKYTADHGGVPSNSYNDALGSVPGTSVWFGINNNHSRKTERNIRPILKVTAEVAPWLRLTAEGNMNIYSVEEEVKDLGQGYKNEGGYYRLGHSNLQQQTGKFIADLHKTFGNISQNLIIGGEYFHTKNTFTRSWTDGGFIVPGEFFLNNSKKKIQTEGGVNGEKVLSSFYFLYNTGWKEQLFIDITGRNDWSSALVYANGKGTYSYFYPSVSASWLFNQTLQLPSWVSFGKVRLSWAQVGNDTNPYTINSGYNVGQLLSGNDYIYTNSYNRMLIDPNLRPERKTSYEVGADIRFFSNRLGLDLTLYKENTRDQIVDIPAPLESGASGQLINAGNIENRGIEIALNTTPVSTQNFRWDLNFIYTKNQNKIISLHEDVGEYKKLEGDPAYGNYRIGSVAYIGGEYGVLLSDALPEIYQALDAQGNKIDHPNNGKKVLIWNGVRKGAYYKRSGKIQKVGTMLPDLEGSVSNNFTFKNISLNVLVDMRFGGKIASYSNRYGTAYGYLKNSLYARDAANGGETWTSQYNESKGQSFDDGVIPDGVFATGTMVTTPTGESVNVGGMSYLEAYNKGYVEPTHASYWTYRNYSWGTGIVDDSWVSEVNYVALRHVSIGYNVPQKFASKLRLNNVYVGVDGHNLGYLYNSLPNHLNPESTRGNSSSYSYFERVLSPYVASYTFTVKLNF